MTLLGELARDRTVASTPTPQRENASNGGLLLWNGLHPLPWPWGAEPEWRGTEPLDYVALVRQGGASMKDSIIWHQLQALVRLAADGLPTDLAIIPGSWE